MANDPLLYSIIFFLYAFGAAVIIPIPVELGLFIPTTVPWYAKMLILGSGKAVGAMVVFKIGMSLGDDVRKWSERFKWYARFVDWMTRFVDKYGYVALYLILSIPLMVDTVPLYIFSLYNDTTDGDGMYMKGFAIVNFLGGCTRALMIFAIFSLFGMKLV